MLFGMAREVDRYHAPMRLAWALALVLGCSVPPSTANAATTAAQQAAPEAATGYVARAPVFAERFLAVTANAHATRAAVAVLDAGGNAVDAAIAAQMVLGLVEPQSSGIGGGAFLLLYDARTRHVLA